MSGLAIQAQAENLSKQIHAPAAHPDFTVSDDWLRRRKERHSISQVKINGEVKSADTVAAEHYSSQSFNSLCKSNN